MPYVIHVKLNLTRLSKPCLNNVFTSPTHAKRVHYPPVLLITGNVFGEAGLLENKKRKATVRTVRVSKFLVLEMREFHRIASNHPLQMEKMQQINLSRASQAS